MSIAVMVRVWKDYPGPGGSELLALLALADWSDDEGRCWPAMSSIAAKIRLSESQARRVIHSLIADGYLAVLGNVNGGNPKMTRQYQIIFDALKPNKTPGAGATPGMDATPGAGARDPWRRCAPTPSAHDTQTIIEPSRTTITREQAPAPRMTGTQKTKTESTTLKAFLETCKVDGKKPIPDDDPIFDYAEQIGIEVEMLEIAWAEFKARFLPTTKCQKDWRAHYRNAVRRNWYGLWFLKEGEQARWTTAGEQARREAA